MKVYIPAVTDPFENKRRAKELLQICAEFSATPTAEGPDNFSVTFGRGVSRANIQQFIEAVGARGVSIEQSDAPALAPDAINAAVLRGAMDRGEIATEKLLPEDLWNTVDSADVSAETAADPDTLHQAIQEMRGEIGEDELFTRRYEPSDEFDVKVLDKQLADFRNSGEAARYHRDSDF